MEKVSQKSHGAVSLIFRSQLDKPKFLRFKKRYGWNKLESYDKQNSNIQSAVLRSLWS